MNITSCILGFSPSPPRYPRSVPRFFLAEERDDTGGNQRNRREGQERVDHGRIESGVKADGVKQDGYDVDRQAERNQRDSENGLGFTGNLELHSKKLLLYQI